MVAAGCMVLYGYDAAVFNAVQTNTYWLKWFNTPVRCPWKQENRPVLTYFNRLVNFLVWSIQHIRSAPFALVGSSVAQ
jgi:hypothetical protein